MLSIEHIRTICTGRIAISEPLARVTTFRIGGPADIFVEPASAEELVALLRYFRECDLAYLVLGNGSNVLVSDDGFRGAAINLESGFSAISMAGGIITAGAGTRLAAFVDFCITHGKAGAEMLAGIPGTLGGAVIMNAGAYGGEISDHLIDVTLVRRGEPVTLAREDCGFAYRRSELRDAIVLSVRFHLPDGDMEELKRRRKELLLKRNAAQPTSLPNAGSIFKNPPGTYAAKLIEACGLKGRRVGAAEVSTLHANFIVHRGDASARDVLALMVQVRDAVLRETGVALEPEIRLIGFAREDLLPLGGAPAGDTARGNAAGSGHQSNEESQ